MFSNKNNITSGLLYNAYRFLDKHSTQLCWTASFAANRFISRVPGESYKDSGILATIVGSVAAFDIALRYGEYVSTYAITYGSFSASYALPIVNNIIQQNNDNFLSSYVGKIILQSIVPLTGLSVAFIVNQGYLIQSVGPVITGAINYKTYGLRSAIPITITSIFEEFLIHHNITNNHYFSVAATSAGMIGNFVSNHYFTTSYSVLVSAMFAVQGSELLEIFLPIKSIKQTYATLSKISNNTYDVNMKLETSLITAANTEFSSAILSIQQTIISQQWIGLLSGADQSSAMVGIAKTYILSTSCYVLNNIIFKGTINSISLVSTIKFFTENFYINKVLKPNNFLLLSKSKYDLEKYSEDISSIIGNHFSIYKSVVSSLPCVMIIKSLGNQVLMVPVLAVIGLSYKELLSHISLMIKELGEKQVVASIAIEKIEKHDIENANSLVQSDALDYKINQWRKFTDITNIDNLYKIWLGNVYRFLTNFKSQVIDGSGIPLLILLLQYKNLLDSGNLLQLFYGIKDSVDLLLIKSNSKLSLDQISSSIERLEDYFEALKNQEEDMCSAQIVPEAEELYIKDLIYTRGNKENNITITIPSLSFKFGERYVVTGGNGSGKSSFLLLLDLLSKSVKDDSLLCINGSVAYPTKEVHTITQKEYCPVQADLFSWLIYPKVLENLSLEEKTYYHTRILELMRELKFSSNNITWLVEEFYMPRNNWCADLSGGQVKKIQLMKTVFIPEKCPKILLLDETLGPIDPQSKHNILDKLKEHCNKSIIIMVYHSDNEICAESADFFNHNIHFANGIVSERPLCGTNNSLEELG